MTITYPRDLPDYQLTECTFDLMDNVSSSASGKGLQINLSQVVDPTWKATIQTRLRKPTEYASTAIWSAWKKSLRGMKPFVAYDFGRPNPIAYLTAAASTDIAPAWNGTATVTSLGLSGALGLSGLPATYQAKVGDRVGLEEGGHYGYYEVLEDKTAVAGVATLTVAPFLHTTVFTTAAVARLWRPKCQFILDWNSWSAPATRDFGAISFNAYQRL
ncbi:hypothetical protein [Mesorhizobium sp. B2-5-3]|uniref:hypothetical protein n=1 Tax=Mesorhizobium sp. B2-5-3 TaxID=2589927 RepID=UPI0011271E0E|nr:hypothetical protein [Mesorhizobium sp. B2-5-3]TPK38703.1 hypothetical protein FJ867_08850 [Mesorhizobium sp. B2-5-3]